MDSVGVQKKHRNKDRPHRRSLKQRLSHQKDMLLDELHKAHAERDALMTAAANLKKYGREFSHMYTHTHTQTWVYFFVSTVIDYILSTVLNVPSSMLLCIYLQRMCIGQGRISMCACEVELRAQKPLQCLQPGQLSTHCCLPTFPIFLNMVTRIVIWIPWSLLSCHCNTC